MNVKFDQTSVLEISRKLAATIGTDFFQAIAKHLATALSADCVVVGEFVGGRLERCKSVAAWMDGTPAEFDYFLVDSATKGALLGEPILCRSDARTEYPSDTLLQFLKAEAFVAVPLKTKAGHAIGILMALYRRPLTNLSFPQEILETFAERASLELTRKQHEEKLRDSEQRYRAFIARNTDAMWRVEFDAPIPTDLPEEEQLERIMRTGYFAECNNACAHLLGRERAEDLIGAGLEEIAPVSDPSFRHATLVGIRSDYRATTVELRPPDAQGNWQYRLRTQWGIIEDGKLQRVWGSTRDITKLKKAEMALHALEKRITDLLEAMHLLVVLLDPGGGVAFCNNYFYECTGWSPEALAGKEWIDTVIPPEERNQVRSQLAYLGLHSGSPIHFESSLLGSDGHRKHIEWDCTMLKAAKPDCATCALIGKDLTEFKTLQQLYSQEQFRPDSEKDSAA